MTNQGPATPGTVARCEHCDRPKARKEQLLGANVDGDQGIHCWKDLYAGEWHLTECLHLHVERLKAENASLLESLREAKERALRVFDAHEREMNGYLDRLHAAEQRAEAAEKALTELLRLYDWRFVLAEREGRSLTASLDFVHETRRLLRQYGMEKKAAWESARAALQEAAKGRAPQAPLDSASSAGAALHDEER